MSASKLRCSYGPVPSRRLGKSLGINNIPAKVCTYSCIYCQAGKTTALIQDPRTFYKPEDIFRDVRERLAKTKEMGQRADYLAFVPDGEPTLDTRLGDELTLLKPLGLPVGVITNGSLLWRDDVREALGRADWVSLKIDAVEEKTWRRMNRPQKALVLSTILDGMMVFSGTFKGKLATETMLVHRVNDGEASIAETASFIRQLHPSVAYLSIPIRPPLLKRVQTPDRQALKRACRIFAEKLPRVECLADYEGDDFAFTGDIAMDLLSITAVHPMRRDAVLRLLSRAGASWSVVERLMARGELAQTEHEGHLFYTRKFPESHDSSAVPAPQKEKWLQN